MLTNIFQNATIVLLTNQWNIHKVRLSSKSSQLQQFQIVNMLFFKIQKQQLNMCPHQYVYNMYIFQNEKSSSTNWPIKYP